MAAKHKYCKRYETVDEPVGWFKHFYRPVSVLRWASVWNQTWVSLYWCFLVTYRHTDFILQCLPPPCGEKSAAATDLSFQAVTKERPPSVPGLSVLLWASKSIICSAHLKRAPGAHIPNPSSVNHRLLPVFIFWLIHVLCPCGFRCDHECLIVSALEQAAAWCFNGQLTNI